MIHWKESDAEDTSCRSAVLPFDYSTNRIIVKNGVQRKEHAKPQ